MRICISNEFSGDVDAAKEQLFEYHGKVMIFSEMQVLKNYFLFRIVFLRHSRMCSMKTKEEAKEMEGMDLGSGVYNKRIKTIPRL